jgi:putative FmdB family regulatory protein
MPTYDYRCKACGHTLELFQSITEGAKRKCPACGRNRLERQIGAGAGILFKGSGFYQTDYRSASYEKAAKAESSGDAAPKDGSKEASKEAPTTESRGAQGSGDGAKSETKPAPKKKAAE